MEDQYKKAKEIESIYKGCFSTELGIRCLANLKSAFIDRPIYKPGATLEETAYRQGQADLVKQIIEQVEVK